MDELAETQALARAGIVRVRFGDAAALIRRPTLIGALIGKAIAAIEVVALSAAERAKHISDVDSLARLLGAGDRSQAALTARERSLLTRAAEHPHISPLAARSITLLTAT